MMEFVSWDDDIPNIWKNKIHVPNHQPGFNGDLWRFNGDSMVIYGHVMVIFMVIYGDFMKNYRNIYDSIGD